MWCVPYLESLPYEELWALCLDASHRLLCCRQVSSGGSSTLLVDVRQLFALILEDPACKGFVLVHNHPGGRAQPSKEDEVFTVQVAALSKALQVRLYDHIICAGKETYSFLESGMLQDFQDTPNSKAPRL